jgi:hypothetical protein
VTDSEVVRAWIAARLDEDEQVVKDAPYVLDGQEWPFWIDVDDDYDYKAAGQWRDRFPPSRSLREVEAKRRRLDRHLNVEVWAGHDHIPPGQPGARQLIAVECSWCIEDTCPKECAAYDCRHAARSWPCAEIVDDAQAWADRGDMPEELKLP